MIKSFTITNHLDETITLDIRSPEESGFLILNADGLSPSKASINVSEITGGDGSTYNSARVNSRNIVFSLRFIENPTIEDTRQNSYKYFPIKKRVRIVVETDNRTCETYGYIEDNSVPIFTKEQGATISVICTDPYFYDVVLQHTIFSSNEAMFSFPFSNESLSENLIIFTAISSGTIKTIVYNGDAEVGALFHIHAIDSASNLSIRNAGTNEEILIDSAKLVTLTGSDIVAGDDIYISTVVGDKYARLIRGGTTYNIINTLGLYPDWFSLVKGDNIFTYDADSGLENLQFEVTNKVAYEGI
jgi:hypothetical protein